VWRDRFKEEPSRGLMGGAVRGTLSTVLTIYIIFCMAAKKALFVPYFL
jgi:hypothetical protein